MRKLNFLLGLVFITALGAQTDTSKLDVQVSYTGSGTVDEGHKVFVVLWDTPDFVKGDANVPPVAIKTATSKSEVVHFEDLSKSPVYVSMVYDPTGKWDAASAPSSGSAVGLYSTEPGTPAPVKLDPHTTTKVSATFDDSQKMP